MPNDPVTDALNSAKSALEKANKFTESVEGNSTSPTFAPKKPEAPKIPQARKPSYGLASQARALVRGYGDEAKGLKARSDNVKQYMDADKK